jgi:hypothetical protein
MQFCSVRMWWLKIFFSIFPVKAVFVHSDLIWHDITAVEFPPGGSSRIFFFLWRCDPTQVMTLFLRFLDHTQRLTTVGRTPLDEWSSRRRDFYLTTHNNHNRQTSMFPVGFEPTIPAGERPQTYDVDRAATGTGSSRIYMYKNRKETAIYKRWNNTQTTQKHKIHKIENDVQNKETYMTRILLTHWGRGHLNCLNARSRGF